jgi:transcriptional regulator with XRE-family HTH domain
MQDAGLSRQDVATLAGVNPSQVSRWIAGANRPNFDALQNLARAVTERNSSLPEGERCPDLPGALDALITAAGYGGGDPDQPAASPLSGLPADLAAILRLLGTDAVEKALSLGPDFIGAIRNMTELDERDREAVLGLTRLLRQRQANRDPAGDDDPVAR